jgi:hypothetical protein
VESSVYSELKRIGEEAVMGLSHGDLDHQPEGVEENYRKIFSFFNHSFFQLFNS